MTANWASMSRILNQMPMFSARSATARLKMGMKSFSFTARAIQSNPIQIQYHMISNSIFSIIPVPLQYLQPTGSSSNSFLITNRRLSLTSFGVLLIRALYSIFVNTFKKLQLELYPPCFTDKLLCVQPDLHPVVEESEERGQGKSGNKDGDEAELKH